VSQRREVSSIVALVAPLGGPARPYARHVRGTIHAEQVVAALRYFRRRIVLAFVAAHPDGYRLEWLPAYAPELNPEELRNGAVKRQTLDALPDSVDALHQQARRGFVRLGRRPAVLRGFFHHVGLALPNHRAGH
jgi:hypothetical protein